MLLTTKYISGYVCTICFLFRLPTLFRAVDTQMTTVYIRDLGKQTHVKSEAPAV